MQDATDSNIEMHSVHMVQPTEYANTNIFKIGSRIKFCELQTYYGEDVNVQIFTVVEDEILIEEKIRRAFNERFELVKGTQFFRGDMHKMWFAFTDVLLNRSRV